MKVLGDLRMYGRFARRLGSFLRHPISVTEARAIVERRLAEREANFLRLVERGIFGYPTSPYRPLLRLAGCELGDIRATVRARGLEETLRTLREAGVYVGFEEFKGREPMVRAGQVIPVDASAFDNPYLSPAYFTSSGGTTGTGTRVSTDLDHLANLTPPLMLTRDVHGVLDVPAALWRPILPSGSGIDNVLRAARMGRPPRKWFTPVVPRDLRPTLKYHLATYGIVATGRLLGVPLPWPEGVSFDRAVVIARWAVETVKRDGACLIMTPVSSALRVCVAAREHSLDLTGATFMIAGEPATPAKTAGITRTGARYFPTYGLAESGRVGMGCGRPADESDLHFLRDAFALLPYPRQVPGFDITVPAFNLTSLLPSTPKILLNVEIDDYGVFERRSCGCPLEAYGYPEHLREIRSFRKLTGEGVTLVGSEMVRILEEVLPARFGGSSLDYQFLEEEDDAGFTRMSLLVSPRLSIADEAAVVETVVAAMRQGSVAADMAAALWGQAKTLRVKRVEPIWSTRGKLSPLHVVRHAGSPAPTTPGPTARAGKGP